jgi:hypothetical protein
MGLGGYSATWLEIVLTCFRKDITVYSPTVDSTQAIPNSRKRDMRESNRGLSDLTGRQLGRRAR